MMIVKNKEIENKEEQEEVISKDNDSSTSEDDQSEENYQSRKKVTYYSEDYLEMYKLQRKLEKEATYELIGIQCDDSEDEEELREVKIKRKRKQLDVKKLQNTVNQDQNATKNEENNKKGKKREEIFAIRKMAEEKFNQNLVNEQKLLQLVNSCQPIQGNLKKAKLQINSIEFNIMRQNVLLFEKINAKTSWDHFNKFSSDLFLKNIELSFIGTNNQIELALQLFDLITSTVNEIKQQIGIIEAQINIPTLFLKRVIGQNHLNLFLLFLIFVFIFFFNKVKYGKKIFFKYFL